MSDDFIARANVEHYRRLLATENMDEHKRKIVLDLLAQEEQKLAAATGQHEPSKHRRWT